MWDPIRAMARWNLKVDPLLIKEDLVAKKPDMVAKMTQRINDLYQQEQVVKGVLASEDGVAVTEVPYYMAFARIISRLQRTHPGGAQLNNDVALWLAKFKGMGLTEAILKRVRDEVFSIPAPGAP